jgi:DNA polymerase-3 subunit delta'
MAFRDLVGQKEIKSRLTPMFEGEAAQSFLITGAPGIGKHTFGRELAKALMCESPTGDGACGKCPSCTYFDAGTHPDFKSFEAQKGKKTIRIEDLRSGLISEIAVNPQISQRKVYMIDADKLADVSQNLLLKSLEEPPKGVAFILLCSDQSKLLGTILSRVTTLQLQPYSSDEVAQILKASGKCDGDETKIRFCADFSAGIPGKALSLADDEDFASEREQIFDFVMRCPKMSVTDILTDEVEYWNNNSDKTDELLQLLQWTLGDVAMLLASPDKGQLKNADKADEIKHFISDVRGLTLINVSNAVNAVTEFAKGLKVNVSYDAACCSMLLKIHKELAR